MTYQASTITRHGDDKHFVEGIGNGFGFYASTLWPQTGFSTMADAEAAAILCNVAFEQGRQAAQLAMRHALGVAP